MKIIKKHVPFFLLIRYIGKNLIINEEFFISKKTGEIFKVLLYLDIDFIT